MSDDKGIDARERQAALFDTIVREAERVASHARTAATHFRNRGIPRGVAHAFALEGHLVNIRRTLDEAAIVHAARSNPLP